MTRSEQKQMAAIERQCKAANCGCSQWVDVVAQLPKSGKTVLASYPNYASKVRIIRAKYLEPKTVEAHMDSDDSCSEYDEATDTYWLQGGWYECIDNWGDYSSVQVCEGNVTHWMPLPEAPAAAPAAPTEGARDASAQQDERESFKAWCRSKGMGLELPARDLSTWEAACAWQRSQQVQADEGVGTAVAWVYECKQPYCDPEQWAEFVRRGVKPTENERVRIVQPLYAHPDPLLAEAVEALEKAKWALSIKSGHSIRADAEAGIDAFLAKVQAAKERVLPGAPR